MFGYREMYVWYSFDKSLSARGPLTDDSGRSYLWAAVNLEWGVSGVTHTAGHHQAIASWKDNQRHFVSVVGFTTISQVNLWYSQCTLHLDEDENTWNNTRCMFGTCSMGSCWWIYRVWTIFRHISLLKELTWHQILMFNTNMTWLLLKKCCQMSSRNRR